MSERPRNKPVTPSWPVDFSSRYPDVLRRMDDNFLRGSASGASGIGPGSRRGSNWGSRVSSGGIFGGGSVSPEWYRWLAISASSGSGVAIVLIYLAVR